MALKKQWRAIVAGVGNILMRDDGVGVHVAGRMADSMPEGTMALDVGTAILHALSFVAQAERLVVVDAMMSGGEPGSVYVADAGDLVLPDRFTSVHSLGLVSATMTLPEHERPSEIVVVGVEPAVVAYGMTLSPAVAAAVPRARRAVEEVLCKSWNISTDRGQALARAS